MTAIVTFSRGSGYGYEEEIRMFKGDYEDEIKENIRKYKEDNYPHHRCNYTIIDHLDSYKSCYISSSNL